MYCMLPIKRNQKETMTKKKPLEISRVAPAPHFGNVASGGPNETPDEPLGPGKNTWCRQNSCQRLFCGQSRGEAASLQIQAFPVTICALKSQPPHLTSSCKSCCADTFTAACEKHTTINHSVFA